MMDNEHYGSGWLFYQCGGAHSGLSFPMLDDPLDLLEWMKGFGAAMADDYGPPTSLQAALLACGIDGSDLEELLEAAEIIRDGEEWRRWPADRPIREGNLPKAANDEMD